MDGLHHGGAVVPAGEEELGGRGIGAVGQVLDVLIVGPLLIVHRGHGAVLAGPLHAVAGLAPVPVLVDGDGGLQVDLPVQGQNLVLVQGGDPVLVGHGDVVAVHHHPAVLPLLHHQIQAALVVDVQGEAVPAPVGLGGVLGLDGHVVDGPEAIGLGVRQIDGEGAALCAVGLDLSNHGLAAVIVGDRQLELGVVPHVIVGQHIAQVQGALVHQIEALRPLQRHRHRPGHHRDGGAAGEGLCAAGHVGDGVGRQLQGIAGLAAGGDLVQARQGVGLDGGQALPLAAPHGEVGAGEGGVGVRGVVGKFHGVQQLSGGLVVPVQAALEHLDGEGGGGFVAGILHVLLHQVARPAQGHVVPRPDGELVLRDAEIGGVALAHGEGGHLLAVGAVVLIGRVLGAVPIGRQIAVDRPDVEVGRAGAVEGDLAGRGVDAGHVLVVGVPAQLGPGVIPRAGDLGIELQALLRGRVDKHVLRGPAFVGGDLDVIRRQGGGGINREGGIGLVDPLPGFFAPQLHDEAAVLKQVQHIQRKGSGQLGGIGPVVQQQGDDPLLAVHQDDPLQHTADIVGAVKGVGHEKLPELGLVVLAALISHRKHKFYRHLGGSLLRVVVYWLQFARRSGDGHISYGIAQHRRLV